MAVGETPTPEYQRGTELPYGAAQQANELRGLVDESRPVEFQPKTPQEQFLFSPTDRPDEPVTAGAPIGGGRNVTRHVVDTPQDFQARVVQEIQADPNPPREVKALLQRMAEGM